VARKCRQRLTVETHLLLATRTDGAPLAPRAGTDACFVIDAGSYLVAAYCAYGLRGAVFLPQLLSPGSSKGFVTAFALPHAAQGVTADLSDGQLCSQGRSGKQASARYPSASRRWPLSKLATLCATLDVARFS